MEFGFFSAYFVGKHGGMLVLLGLVPHIKGPSCSKIFIIISWSLPHSDDLLPSAIYFFDICALHDFDMQKRHDKFKVRCVYTLQH